MHAHIYIYINFIYFIYTRLLHAHFYKQRQAEIG